MATKIVDFIPSPSLGDFNKISDTNILRTNTRLVNLFHMLDIESGTHIIYPDVGINDKLEEMLFNEDYMSVMNSVSNVIQKYLGEDILIEPDYNVNDDSLSIVITIDDVPGSIRASLDFSGNYVKIVDPRYLK